MEQQLILILIIGAISLVNWLIDKSAKQREKRRIESLENEVQAPSHPHPVEPQQTKQTEESLREFMDTFGFPLSVEPASNPPQVTPPTLEPPLPPLSAVRQNLTPPPTAPIRHQVPRVSHQRSNRWASLLHSRGTTRQAMILSEILGPPRSQSLH